MIFETASPVRTNRIPHRLVALLLAVGAILLAAAIVSFARDHEFFARTFGRGRFAVLLGILTGLILTLAVLRRTLRSAADSRRGAAQLRCFAYLSIGMLTAFVLLGLKPHPPSVLLSASLLFTVFALVVEWGEVIARPVSPRVRGILDLVAMNACVLLVAGEIGLRLLGRANVILLTDRYVKTTPQRMKAFGLPPGYLYLGFSMNSLGFYDTEFVARGPGEPGTLVVSIGDSFSSSIVPHHAHFTTVCERTLLDTDVYNVGVATAQPWDYLHWIETVAVPLNPDLIVVNLFVGNDVVELELAERTWLQNVWPHRENVKLWMLVDRWTRIAGGVESRNPNGLDSTAAASDIDASRGKQVVPAEELERELPWLRNPLFERPTYTPEAYLKIESMRASDIGTGERPGYVTLDAVLREMKVKAGRIPLAVMLIPDEFQVSDDLWARVVSSLPGTTLDRDFAQKRIRASLEAAAIPFEDLLPRLRAVEPFPDGDRHLYHLRDSHFNQRGNRIAGLALADLVRRVLGH